MAKKDKPDSAKPVSGTTADSSGTTDESVENTSDGVSDQVEDAEIITVTREGEAKTADVDPSDTGESDRTAAARDEELDEMTSAVPVATAPVQPDPPRRGGAGAAVLGGVIAAGVGAGAMWLATAQGWLPTGNQAASTEALAEQSARIDALETELAEARAALDGVARDDDLAAAMTAIETRLDALTEADADAATAADAALAALSERIDNLATQPIPEARLPESITTAFDRELAEALGTVDARFAEMQTALDARLAEIEAAANQADTLEAEARAAAARARASAALAEVQAAVDTGQAFAEPLDRLTNLTGTDAPGALLATAETGVPTLAELQDSFPDSARDALRAATAAGIESGETDRWTAFFRTQLGARSIAPRDGNDPDAVLSRAEAALAAGDLAAALDTLSALAQAGREAPLMSEWLDRAQIRQDALLATSAIAATLATESQ